MTKKRKNQWTVKADEDARRRGKTEAYFRVRVVDSGYRVGLVYRDESGARREPYLCYLSAKEWKSAKQSSPSAFARLVSEKIEQRKAGEGADTGKLDELLRRVRTFK